MTTATKPAEQTYTVQTWKDGQLTATHIAGATWDDAWALYMGIIADQSDRVAGPTSPYQAVLTDPDGGRSILTVRNDQDGPLFEVPAPVTVVPLPQDGGTWRLQAQGRDLTDDEACAITFRAEPKLVRLGAYVEVVDPSGIRIGHVKSGVYHDTNVVLGEWAYVEVTIDLM